MAGDDGDGDEYPACCDCQDGCGGCASEECHDDGHSTTIDGVEYGICDCDGQCDHFDGYLGDWTQPCNRGHDDGDDEFFKVYGDSYEGLDAACVGMGGRLASVLSSDDTDKAIAACSSDGDYNDMCYVGLRWDGAAWVWLDGSTYDYNYFDGGQGTNGDNEPCAAFYVNGGWSDQAMWHDISCPSGPTMEGADVAGICKREELNWDVPPGTIYHGGGNGWCSSDLDSYNGEFDTPDQCWESCVGTYGDMVAAIELNGYGGSCYCQSSCDCMAEGGDDQMVLTRDWITSLPSECEDDDGDCTAGYAKIKCVGTILYHAECGEWCSDECMFRDFTAETGGMYYCDISDPFTYIYDADLDGIPEDTGALPVLDANGCYYDNCDDDDDEDDYNHLCLEDCDNQCMSDLSCLEDCPIGVSLSKKPWNLFAMVISASITLLVGQCDAQRLSL